MKPKLKRGDLVRIDSAGIGYLCDGKVGILTVLHKITPFGSQLCYVRLAIGEEIMVPISWVHLLSEAQSAV